MHYLLKVCSYRLDHQCHLQRKTKHQFFCLFATGKSTCFKPFSAARSWNIWPLSCNNLWLCPTVTLNYPPRPCPSLPLTATYSMWQFVALPCRSSAMCWAEDLLWAGLIRLSSHLTLTALSPPEHSTVNALREREEKSLTPPPPPLSPLPPLHPHSSFLPPLFQQAVGGKEEVPLPSPPLFSRLPIGLW